MTTSVLRPPATPLRAVTPAERTAFARDGVVHLTGVIPQAWVDLLRTAVDRLMDRPSTSSQNYTSDGEPRFFSQVLPRFLDPVFEKWSNDGPTRHLAAQLQPEVTHLRAFFDQVFAMEPGAPVGAPYHQDHPYIPLTGEHFFRIWVPLDPVTAENGAVRYLKGSHLGPVYRPRSFSGDRAVEAVYARSPYPEGPDYEQDSDPDAWFVGEALPGDALVHHPKTVHGSPANTSTRYRRAVTTMYVGDDVRWDPRDGTSFAHMAGVPGLDALAMPAGQPVGGAAFPVVWER